MSAFSLSDNGNRLGRHYCYLHFIDKETEAWGELGRWLMSVQIVSNEEKM